MKTTTSIKIDKDIKEQATSIANDLGVSLSTVVNATLKKFVTERRVVLSLAPEFNEKAKKEFLKLRDDVRKNKNLSKVYTDLNSLKKGLLE
ncbi:MAG TPA: type II toxin-antitoxin system RelB/DinJ family antitoxin [Candidatus Paceibacterota bacterium]|nr:type II toxin-antitoxin system RelB/DinJ family antitoxin [Candidatus Paceibacterota bacterium]HMP19206.1 type II toxin-antitoxin system RelB/DinJ family antitoxin [Candidatus Paceibacterota bacterium]HMP85352.1 type II toxin-antitoxin system RelB/DinJ family antitoxin [Candidatus Paceibacterota bacterium]